LWDKCNKTAVDQKLHCIEIYVTLYLFYSTLKEEGIIENKTKNFQEQKKDASCGGLLQITYTKLIGIDGQACYYAVLLRFNKEMLMK
jgi:hypothetical protein